MSHDNGPSDYCREWVRRTIEEYERRGIPHRKAKRMAWSYARRLGLEVGDG